jgi:hypothetical protein
MHQEAEGLGVSATNTVMAGLVPAIHVFAHCESVKTWMPGTSPGHDEFL